MAPRSAQSEEAPATGYIESEGHVPNPTDQYGSMDTSGTSGDRHRIEQVSPIFDQAHAHDMRTAARALDPADDSVHESLVVLPSGQNIVPVDPDGAKDRVLAKASASADAEAAAAAAKPTAPESGSGQGEGEQPS
jgi:hypothetical protein